MDLSKAILETVQVMR